MREDHALGVAGRARGEHHRGRRVELLVLEARQERTQQRRSGRPWPRPPPRPCRACPPSPACPPEQTSVPLGVSWTFSSTFLRGHDVLDPGLVDGRVDHGLAGRVIQVDRDLAQQMQRDVGDRRRRRSAGPSARRRAPAPARGPAPGPGPGRGSGPSRRSGSPPVLSAIATFDQFARAVSTNALGSDRQAAGSGGKGTSGTAEPASPGLSVVCTLMAIARDPTPRLGATVEA